MGIGGRIPTAENPDLKPDGEVIGYTLATSHNLNNHFQCPCGSAICEPQPEMGADGVMVHVPTPSLCSACVDELAREFPAGGHYIGCGGCGERQSDCVCRACGGCGRRLDICSCGTGEAT